MFSKKNKSKSLSEKIAESFEAKPLRDPEIDSEDETAAKLVYSDDDEDLKTALKYTTISDIRKRNVKLLSECSSKYEGVVSSRKEFDLNKDQSTEKEIDSSSESDDDLEEYRKRLRNYQIDSEPDESLGTDEETEEEESHSNDDVEPGDSDYDSSGGSISESEQSDVENDKNSELLKDKDQTGDIKKGLSVQNQLKIWEKLLEVRIYSQKMLVNSNSLPSSDLFNKFCEENEDFLNLAKEAQQNVTGLLEKMLEMQQILLKQYPETKNLAQKSSATKRKIPLEDFEKIPVKRFASELTESFSNFESYRNSVLQKWHDRTKILTPGIGTKGNKSSHLNNFDILKKIDGALLNKADMIKKSQIVKGNYTVFNNKNENLSNTGTDQNTEEAKGTEQPTVTSTEIYDDTDFYHQQLRELIEYKSSTSSNPAEINKQFVELQKLRHKMKKKVDTRATKGRKIRYVVHNKLVNFMAPNTNTSWTEESKNELYHSLFAT